MQRSLRFGLAALMLAIFFGLAIVMGVVFWQLLSSVTDEQADSPQATATAVPPAYIWESGGYLSAVFVPDGRLAVASSYQTTILSFPDNQALTFFPTGGYLAVSPDSSRLAVGQRGAVRIYDLASGKVRAYLVCWLPPEEWTEMWLAFSPDGRTLAVTEANPAHGPEVQLWNVANQGQLWSVRIDDPAITVARQLAFSPDGRYIAVTTLPEGVWLIDVAQPAVVRQIQAEPAGSIAFSPDGSRLSVGGYTIRTYDTATWELVHEQTFPVSDAPTATEPSTLTNTFRLDSMRVAISPDGQWLAAPAAYPASGADLFVGKDPPRQPIALRRLADGEQVYRLSGSQNRARHLMFSPDGQWLVDIGHNEIQVWPVGEEGLRS
ncbi:hypothetical protein A6A03_03585 [Chloroflexus islandicus]|uniref:WD40 repeat domain-containing protein n=1 Tax=Chloroflexus islandicus TaxID=1707952 RepID=A0A178M3I1_9CHLR|nr:PD40 domain-containing protein [Chloroflexus islandicus]OAN42810.1 hypothetical protein A6A03_03585 [Chloroflexus islandicus]